MPSPEIITGADETIRRFVAASMLGELIQLLENDSVATAKLDPFVERRLEGLSDVVEHLGLRPTGVSEDSAIVVAGGNSLLTLQKAGTNAGRPEVVWKKVAWDSQTYKHNVERTFPSGNNKWVDVFRGSLFDYDEASLSSWVYAEDCTVRCRLDDTVGCRVFRNY